MPIINRRANRDGAAKRTGNSLPGRNGETIVGGPMKPLNLMEILSRGEPGVSAAGAAAGAAPAVTGSPEASPVKDRGIALSDGSRIIFLSVDQDRVLTEA